MPNVLTLSSTLLTEAAAFCNRYIAYDGCSEEQLDLAARFAPEACYKDVMLDEAERCEKASELIKRCPD